MKEIAKNTPRASISQVAILAALNIADEYFQIKEHSGDTSDVMVQRTNALIALLEEGLIGDSFKPEEKIS